MVEPKVMDDALLSVLGGIRLFHGLDRLQLIWLLSATSRVAVGAGGLFFDEGDPGDRLFVFINGSAVVEKRTRDGWTTLATLKPGEAFGEMAVVDQLPRSARVRAVANSLALSLTRARLDGSPDVAAAVYRNIAVMQTLRLRATNERLAGSTDKD